MTCVPAQHNSGARHFARFVRLYSYWRAYPQDARRRTKARHFGAAGSSSICSSRTRPTRLYSTTTARMPRLSRCPPSRSSPLPTRTRLSLSWVPARRWSRSRRRMTWPTLRSTRLRTARRRIRLYRLGRSRECSSSRRRIRIRQLLRLSFRPLPSQQRRRVPTPRCRQAPYPPRKPRQDARSSPPDEAR